MPSPSPSPRTSKTHLIHALADELRNERARTAALEAMCEQVEEMCREAAEERNQDEDRLIERDRQAKQTIDTLRRQLLHTRSELESATSVALTEASHYLSLLEPSNTRLPDDLRSERGPSSRRRVRRAGAGQSVAGGSEGGRALSEWTELGETAQERLAKRMARLEEELTSRHYTNRTEKEGVHFAEPRHTALSPSPEPLAQSRPPTKVDDFGRPIEVKTREENGASGWGKLFPGLGHLRGGP